MTGVRRLLSAAASALATAALATAPAVADQIVPDDLVVQGSICTGFDCFNDEEFGSDTLRLKENNDRIAFADTSPGPEPGNDWEITANDTASGGPNYLQVLDVTAGRPALRVFGGAPTGALTLTPGGAVRTGTGSLIQREDGTSTELRTGVDGEAVLAALAAVPIARYRLTADPAGPFHVGPFGSAFNTALGLGSGGEVATGDVAGAALAAVQALAPRVAAAAPGTQGPAGPAGPKGSPGDPASPDPAADANGAAVGAGITALNQRLDRLDRLQARLGRRTKALGKRVKRVGRDVARAGGASAVP